MTWKFDKNMTYVVKENQNDYTVFHFKRSNFFQRFFNKKLLHPNEPLQTIFCKTTWYWTQKIGHIYKKIFYEDKQNR